MDNARWRLGPLVGFTALVLLCGLAGEARADLYGYSVLETSTYTLSGGTVGTISPNSLTSAAQLGSPSGSESHVGTQDALQSYVGAGAGRPAENTFTPKGMTTPDYTRADALIGSPIFSTNGVAEAFLSIGANAGGAGAWSSSLPITLAASGSVTLSFHYTDELSVVNTGSSPGAVQADFSYLFSIQNSAGNLVFISAPNAVNEAISLISLGSTTIPGSGSLSITSGTLAAGTYTATISGANHVFMNDPVGTIVPVVPEPSSFVLVCVGFAGLVGLAWRRHRRE
jgi:hypothetical protein